MPTNRPLESAVTTWSQDARRLWGAEGLAMLLERSADIVVVLDGIGRIRFANAAAQGLLGHRPGSLLGTDGFALLHPDDGAVALDAFDRLLATDEPVGPLVLRLRDIQREGRWKFAEFVGLNLLDRSAVAGIVLNIRDVTDRVDAQAALLASGARFRHLADGTAPDFIFRYRVAGAKGFEYASPVAVEITGHTPEELYADPTLVDGLVDPVMVRLTAPDPIGGLRRPFEFEVHRPDGTAIWVQLRRTVHLDEHGEVLAVDGIVQNVTERKNADDTLAHQALHDPLTGLANRARFFDQLDHALHRADRLPGSPAVLFLDLDEFKAVNDTFGHAAGDQVLAAVARQLTGSVRPGDTVGRLGGDEFLVLCDDITSELELEGICDRLRHAVCLPIDVGGRAAIVGVSIGATRAGPQATADELLRLADIAMYADKQSHRSTPVEARYTTHDTT